MNPHSGIDDNNRKNRTKAIAAAIPLAGILVAAALLSGLSMIGNYQPAIAQNMTAGGNATGTTTSPTTAGAGGNTTGTACAPQSGGNMTGAAGGGNMTGAAGAFEGGAAGAAEGGAAGEGDTTTLGTTIVGGNATTAGGAGVNQTTGSPTQLIEQACIAAQNNDTQSVLMNLNAALNALSANATTTAAADDAEGDDGGEEEGEGGEEEGEGGEEEGEGGEEEG